MSGPNTIPATGVVSDAEVEIFVLLAQKFLRDQRYGRKLLCEDIRSALEAFAQSRQPSAQGGGEVERQKLNVALAATIDQRDRGYRFANEMAAQLATITGVDIGEHSSSNNPWQQAILAADDFLASEHHLKPSVHAGSEVNTAESSTTIPAQDAAPVEPALQNLADLNHELGLEFTATPSPAQAEPTSMWANLRSIKAALTGELGVQTRPYLYAEKVAIDDIEFLIGKPTGAAEGAEPTADAGRLDVAAIMEKIPTVARLYYTGLATRRYRRASTMDGPGESLVHRSHVERELNLIAAARAAQKGQP